jgi:hypothetical protein
MARTNLLSKPVGIWVLKGELAGKQRAHEMLVSDKSRRISAAVPSALLAARFMPSISAWRRFNRIRLPIPRDHVFKA